MSRTTTQLLLALPWLLGCAYAPQIREAAGQAGLPPEVVVLIAQAESSCRAGITGPGGARGLFQFEERTWTRDSPRPWAQAYEPKANIEAAVAYLKARGSTDARSLVAWHNAGVRDWRKLNPKWSLHHPNTLYRYVYTHGETP